MGKEESREAIWERGNEEKRWGISVLPANEKKSFSTHSFSCCKFLLNDSTLMQNRTDSAMKKKKTTDEQKCGSRIHWSHNSSCSLLKLKLWNFLINQQGGLAHHLVSDPVPPECRFRFIWSETTKFAEQDNRRERSEEKAKWKKKKICRKTWEDCCREMVA